MRIKPVLISLCAAALMASSASAQTSNTQSDADGKGKQAQEQKKICKWLPVTGSNRQERHCLTKEDWKKAESMTW
jgi:hypothetical protein